MKDNPHSEWWLGCLWDNVRWIGFKFALSICMQCYYVNHNYFEIVLPSSKSELLLPWEIFSLQHSVFFIKFTFISSV